MKSNLKLRVVAALLFSAMVAVGCNPLTGAYFMLFGIDDKVPPEFKLAGDGKKIVHVMVLTSLMQDMQTENLGVDRTLATAVCKRVDADTKANKERIKITPVHKVEEFKTNNPGWRTMPLNEVGRKFDVDYVVDIEVKDLSLYEKGSRRSLFSGRAALTVNVYDVTKSIDEGPVHQRRLTVEYPKTGRPIPVDDMNVERFRELFMARIAQDVSWQLTSHVSTAGYMED